MNELRIPTNALEVEIVSLAGESRAGTIYLPALSAHRSGTMTPYEWINESRPFFPFRPRDAEVSILINRDQILFLGYVPPDIPEESDTPFVKTRFVEVFCGTQRLEGLLTIEMPEGHTRVLDFINQPDIFLPLWDGKRMLLIRKSQVINIRELTEE